MKRADKILAMVRESSSTKPNSYVLLKLLEKDVFSVYRKSDLKCTEVPHLYTVTYQGKTCKAISVISGEGRSDLERYVIQLKSYEEQFKRFQHLNGISQWVQTDTCLAEASTQTNEEHFIPSAGSVQDYEGTTEKAQISLPKENYSEDRENMLVGDSKYSKKKHFCKFCFKLIGNFTRHFTNIHKDQEEYKEYASLNKADKLKKMKMIISEGDKLYNKENPNNAIPVRNTHASAKTSHERLPCPNCQGMYSSSHLTMHFKKCDKEFNTINPRSIRKKSYNLKMTNDNNTMSESFKMIIWPNLRDDHLKKEIKHDSDLIDYGNTLCKRYTSDTQGKFIRQTLRMVANIVHEMKNIDETLKNSADAFLPKRYDIFVQSIRTLCELGKGERGGYKAPAVVNQYGQQFRKYSQFILSKCIKGQAFIETTRSQIIDWQILYDSTFNLEIGAQARKQAERKTVDARETIPYSDDVKLLSDYLSNLAKTSYEKLINETSKKQIDESAYKSLGEALLVKLWLFNRKRVGEVEKILLEDWKNKTVADEESDAFRGLTASEKLNSSNFLRLSIRGKLNRKVGLLIHKNDEPYFDMFLTMRKFANIEKGNPYLFADRDSFLEGTRLMRKFSTLCGAKRPDLLRGTKLRKHLATTIQISNLTDEDLNQVAKSLGHTDKTHMSSYRGDHSAIHMGRISKILHAVDQNELENIRGKTLMDLEPGNNQINREETFLKTPDIGASDSVAKSSRDEIEPPIDLLPSTSRRNDDQDDHSYSPSESSSESAHTLERTPVKNRLRRFSNRAVPTRMPWGSPIKKIIWTEFQKEIEENRLPSLQRCREFLKENKNHFGQRTPAQLKSYVHNTCKRMVKYNSRNSKK